jgi:glycosyltransferase involved in cell wall biosynthesis
MFSIIIPTYNNLACLKICIKSIQKNSKYKHEIIVHVNEGKDGTINFLKKKKFLIAGLLKMLVYVKQLI